MLAVAGRCGVALRASDRFLMAAAFFLFLLNVGIVKLLLAGKGAVAACYKDIGHPVRAHFRQHGIQRLRRALLQLFCLSRNGGGQRHQRAGIVALVHRILLVGKIQIGRIQPGCQNRFVYLGLIGIGDGRKQIGFFIFLFDAGWKQEHQPRKNARKTASDFVFFHDPVLFTIWFPRRKSTARSGN